MKLVVSGLSLGLVPKGHQLPAISYLVVRYEIADRPRPTAVTCQVRGNVQQSYGGP